METQAIGEGLAFEKVWAAIQATNEQVKESARRHEKTGRTIDRILKENARRHEETGRQMKATDKRIGELTNRFGDMVEHMVLPNLVTEFEKLGFTFTRANRTEIRDRGTRYIHGS